MNFGMKRNSLLFIILYFSLCFLACAIVVMAYRARHIQTKVLSRKYCYRYHATKDAPLPDDVLLVATEALARQSIDYYNIKGNATFGGEIKATLTPFSRVDVLGYGTDSSIVKVRVVYRNFVHRFFSATTGYVPLFTLHDTVPKNKFTYSQYHKELGQKNHIQDSIDSITSHINTTEELKIIRGIAPRDIKRIEIHCIAYNTQQMANIGADAFKAGSKYDYYNIYNHDSISNYITAIRKVLRVNAKDINLKNSAHYGGLTIYYDKDKSLYYSFDRYTQIGDSVFLAMPEYTAYIRNVLNKRTKNVQK